MRCTDLSPAEADPIERFPIPDPILHHHLTPQQSHKSPRPPGLTSPTFSPQKGKGASPAYKYNVYMTSIYICVRVCSALRVTVPLPKWAMYSLQFPIYQPNKPTC